MKFTLLLLLLTCCVSLAFADNLVTFHKVRFNPEDAKTRMYLKSGIIDMDASAEWGWMSEADYLTAKDALRLQSFYSETRAVIFPEISDALGDVVAIYSMPAGVQGAIGLGYDGEYFYLSDFSINSEKIYKMKFDNGFSLVNSYPAPGGDSKNPWGVACDGPAIYIADGIQDAIFKTDTSIYPIGSFNTPGPLATGMGYNAGMLWNADLGQYQPPIPARMYKVDTGGNLQNSWNLGETVNGVAANDSAIFISKNKFNGEKIELMHPTNYSLMKSFPSPMEYPNGLALDGQYLWISGKDQDTNYMVQIDLGYEAPNPQLNWTNFNLIATNRFNNRFDPAFDSQGNMHAVIAIQDSTNSDTKDIVYATNKSGIWEMTNLTDDIPTDELPRIYIDASDIVHIIWNGYVAAEGDIEIFYTHNTSGQFEPKQMITRKSIDGIDGHAYPDFLVDDLGQVHFTFTSFSQSGTAEIYYAVYANGTTSAPVNISNNGQGDYDPQILLDQSGFVHVFWVHWGSKLRHATNAGGSWSSEEITDMSWSRPAIGMDSQGIIHFTVIRQKTVKYGNNSAGNFTVLDTVAVHLGNCFYPDMAIDPYDGIHLTYHSFGDSTITWPGNGEIFYTNNYIWGENDFPTNMSQLPGEQELYPSIAVKNDTSIIVGWAKTGITDGVFSDIRVATTIPGQMGHIAGKINPSENTHDFGYIVPLDTVTWNLTINNSGVAPLTISSLDWQPNDPQFLIYNDLAGTAVLNNGESLQIELRATVDLPVTEDTLNLSGVLLINSDDPMDPVTIVSLEAQAPLTEINDNLYIISKNELLGNFPNPFNPQTSIKYNVRETADVELAIYNIRGQLVNRLHRGKQSAGAYKVVWNGKNSAGIQQASGIYFCRIKIGKKFVDSKRMMLIK